MIPTTVYNVQSKHIISGVKGSTKSLVSRLSLRPARAEENQIKQVGFSLLESGQIWTRSCSLDLVVCPHLRRQHLPPTPLWADTAWAHSATMERFSGTQRDPVSTNLKGIKESCLPWHKLGLPRKFLNKVIHFFIQYLICTCFTFFTKELSHSSGRDLYVTVTVSSYHMFGYWKQKYLCPIYFHLHVHIMAPSHLRVLESRHIHTKHIQCICYNNLAYVYMVSESSCTSCDYAINWPMRLLLYIAYSVFSTYKIILHMLYIVGN